MKTLTVAIAKLSRLHLNPAAFVAAALYPLGASSGKVRFYFLDNVQYGRTTMVWCCPH